MKMHVMNALTAVLATVGNNAIAVVKPESCGDFGDFCKNVRDNRGVALVNVVCAADVLLWNNQNMYGSLRLKVVKREDKLVLIYFF